MFINSKTCAGSKSDRRFLILESLLFVVAVSAYIFFGFHVQEQTGRLGGILDGYGRPNLLAQLLILPIVWGGSLSRRGGAGVAVPGLGCLLAILIGTLSRSGWLATLVAVVYYCAQTMNRRRFLLVIGAVVVLGVSAFLFILPMHHRMMEAYYGVDLSLWHKWVQCQSLCSLVAEHPMGVGLRVLEELREGALRPTHNRTIYGTAPWFVELAVERGAMAAWVSMSIVILCVVRRISKHAVAVAASGVLGITFAGMSESFNQQAITITLLALLVLTCLVLQPPGPRVVAASIVAGGLAICGVCIVGLTFSPPARITHYSDSCVKVRASRGVRWVVWDARSTTVEMKNMGFWRAVAEGGGAYVRGNISEAMSYGVPIVLLTNCDYTDGPWSAVVNWNDSIVDLNRSQFEAAMIVAVANMVSGEPLIPRKAIKGDRHDECQELLLSEKVRDRFYRSVPQSIYDKYLATKPAGGDGNWRKEYFMYYYPLVSGLNAEDYAVRRIVTHALWLQATGINEPDGNVIGTKSELALHVLMACRSVGIAANWNNGEPEYYNDKKDSWMRIEVNELWNRLENARRMAAAGQVVSL